MATINEMIYDVKEKVNLSAEQSDFYDALKTYMNAI